MSALASAFARCAFLSLFAMTPPAALAQASTKAVPDSSGAIAALRVATLAERMAKLHAQAGQGILPERTRRSLSAAMREFDSTLRQIAARAPTVEIRDNYALLMLLWREYREWLARPATRENARALRERTEETAWIAAKGARMWTEHTRGAVNAGAVRASQAALLSQRIPKLYLWRRWGQRDEKLSRELREADENLARLIEALASMPADAPQIEAELRAAQTQYRFMADAARGLEADHSPARAMEFVAKSGDNIFEAMERLAALHDARVRNGARE